MIHDTYFPLGREKKDIFHDRILVESGDLIYDSTSQGIPIYIPPNVLRMLASPKGYHSKFTMMVKRSEKLKMFDGMVKLSEEIFSFIQSTMKK